MFTNNIWRYNLKCENKQDKMEESACVYFRFLFYINIWFIVYRGRLS